MDHRILTSNRTYEVTRFKGRTKTEREGKWLAHRNDGVGGSDMAAIMGLSPYKSPYALWLERTGRSDPEDLSGKWAIQRGNVLEGELRKRFRREHPELTVVGGTDMSLRSVAHPCMQASLDGYIWDPASKSYGVLEIKTANAYRAKDWQADDGSLHAPAYYLAQVTHYMAVTGWTWGVFYADLGSGEPVEVRFERDEQDVAAVIKAAEEFWGYVQRDEPPELTGSDVDDVYPQDDGQIEQTDDEVFRRACDEYLSRSKELSKAKTARDEVAATIKTLIGEHQGLCNDMYKATYKTSHHAQTVRKAYDSRTLRITTINQ
ncbi:YqaJ viral recombinase family protein [Bifidobacterium bombi]|uniref:Phage-type endonuclease, YqaJ family protein n=1 Tax=Bifidobacterium bombi DSM 19703 TaxID=1341695 RepID=A0A080N4S3_9BIFI|nr:YqaJ viral recombinase family protein [Bifidobacterium bombi]KFF31670.1 phage-type endonuclease, YqaJ family protein [Bifidobacterium bombi DSM 19703]